MARQNIFTGTAANDGTGDTLREAFTKVNSNFIELYGTTGSTGNMTFSNNVMSINIDDAIFINNPNDAIQIGGSWLTQMSATSNAVALWGDGNTQAYMWVFQQPDLYAEALSQVENGDLIVSAGITTEPNAIFGISSSILGDNKVLRYALDGILHLPNDVGDIYRDGVSVLNTGEIDGGNAYTSPTAELTVDGGGA